MEKAKESSSLATHILGSAFGAGGGNIESGTLLGNALGGLAGFASPKKVKVVKIPQGSTYILSLQAAVALR